jgi:uncharacterized alpha-E superfamily protein
MLSRTAEAIYWMCRYIERAENIARFIDVNIHLNLDLSVSMGDQWAPLVQVTGDYQAFQKSYGQAGRESVIEFLTFDRAYSNSIVTCLHSARENARSARQTISSEMWEQVNKLYLMAQGTHKGLALEMPHDFFTRIKMASHTFVGVMEATMSHGEAWHFGHLGRMIERADKTSRILDVKYFILLPSIRDVGTPYDNIQWAALLKSASAFEMYRKRYGRISPADVVEFLVLDRQFPRAIHSCLLAAEDSLHAITGAPEDTFSTPAERHLGRLRTDLSYATMEEIIARGLHEYLDEFQSRLNEVDQAIFATFFALRPVGVSA